MNVRIWLRGMVRHTGYALLVLGASLSFIELLMPGFSAPYLHTFFLVVVGLFFTVLGNFGQRFSRLFGGVLGVFLVATTVGLLYAYLPRGRSMVFLTLAVGFVLVAFLLESLYPTDV